jgi:hypothetical protein
MLIIRFAFLIIAWAANGSAAGNRDDYDVDNDGLIEINDLDDLNAIRDDPGGGTLYGFSKGCPAPGGCFGFELTADLNFDTNHDGSVGPGDDQYTDDTNTHFQGFVPIPFLFCELNGNGHSITNLTNRNFSADGPQGLFAELSAAFVHDLNFVNPHFDSFNSPTGVLAGQLTDSQVSAVSVRGGSIFMNNIEQVGGLAGSCNFSQVDECHTALTVRASNKVGGLIGQAENCAISRSFTLGRTTSARYSRDIGGLVGLMSSGSIADSFASGTTGEGQFFGGLVGETEGTPTFTNTFVSGAVVGGGAAGGAMLGFGPATFVSSFYATDTTGYTKTKTAGTGAVAVTLADLKCTDTANDPDCLAGLFAGWQNRLNSDGQPAWDFGTNQQVPGLRIRGVVYRDSDGDGVLDQDDQFPSNWEASRDSDHDGAIDFWREGCGEACRARSTLVLDQFPNKVAAALDLDLDGLPDAWNASCNSACQTASGLTLDTRPGDLDNDGLSDAVDQDDDGNGMADVDLDSDNLIDIHSLPELRLVFNDPTGVSLRLSDTIPDFGIRENNSGCRPRIIAPVTLLETGEIQNEGGVLSRNCDGYELLNDLDFDVNGNGVIDEAEKFWGDPPQFEGWDSLGHLGDDTKQAFQTNFEGNGHVIKNLWIAHDSNNEAGLFGGIRGANIRNLGLTGTLAMVVDPQSFNPTGLAGALAADVIGSTISNCYATIPVSSQGGSMTGGLLGRVMSSTITGSFATGDVQAINQFCGADNCNASGGLVASLSLDSAATASFASGAISTDNGRVGGLAGETLTGSIVSGSFSMGHVQGVANDFGGIGGLIGHSDTNVVASYWATDSSAQATSAGNAQGATNSQLQCPLSADNTSCRPGVTLFNHWGMYVAADDVPYWEMGSASQLPGLCVDQKLYRPDTTTGDLLPVQPCACAEVGQQLVTNQAFETDTSGWTASTGDTIATSTVQKHGGARSLRISNRNTATWQGAIYSLLSLAAPGDTLTASLWARVEGDPSEPVFFTMRSVCQGGAPVFTRIADATATNTGWVQLNGTVVVPSCSLTELTVYAEGPRTGVVLYIDDVSVTHPIIKCTGRSGPLNASFLVTTDWGTGYCVELRITNPGSTPTTDWSAAFSTNGTTIYDAWNVNRTASTGSVTMTPSQPFARVIAAGGTSNSLGFCANRPSGNHSLPSTPVATGVF